MNTNSSTTVSIRRAAPMISIKILATALAVVTGDSGRAATVPTAAAVEAGVQTLVIGKTTPPEDQPFWRSRPSLISRIHADREIIVAVKKEEAPNDQIRFLMTGAGLVNRPKEFCFGVSQEYPKLKDISDHFKTVSFDPVARQLFLVTEALGYQARMILRISPVSEDWRSELQWEVIWGHFKGMTGLVGFEKIDEQKTEMSLNAKYEAAELPLPRMLMGFALEVVTQKVAEKMRAFIEAQPANALEKAPSSAVAGPNSGTSGAGLGGSAAGFRDSAAASVADDPPGAAQLKVPPGFEIKIFASALPGARQMALSPNGTLFVGTMAGSVYAVPGAVAAAARGARATGAKIIAHDLKSPNGVAFHDGSLYVAEISRLLRFDHIEEHLDAAVPKPAVLRRDYPSDEHHGWKYMAIGPDGWLYVPVGMPCNVCLKPDKIYGSLTRLSLDGKKREIFAAGIRNTVGFDWSPKTKEVWFTDNGRDMMGDDVPDDELNRAPKAGLHFGFPFCHAGTVSDPEFGQGKDCTAKGPYVQPEAKLGAHVAGLGMKFYTGHMFPETYQGRIFVAEHGSWNRSNKVGYRVVSVPIAEDGHAGQPEIFAEGWLEGQTAWGRPVDVLNMPDGSLLLSDDTAGLIYRVSYRAAR